MEKELKGFGSPAETSWGYSQGVRVGDTLYLSGQTGGGADGTFGDMETQTRQAYAKIARVLALYGATMENVVDEVIYQSDAPAFRAAAPKVRREVYGGLPAVTSTVMHVPGVGSTGGRLIEIQCTAKL